MSTSSGPLRRTRERRGQEGGGKWVGGENALSGQTFAVPETPTSLVSGTRGALSDLEPP